MNQNIDFSNVAECERIKQKLLEYQKLPFRAKMLFYIKAAVADKQIRSMCKILKCDSGQVVSKFEDLLMTKRNLEMSIKSIKCPLCPIT
jgi:hypothetical protein